jgi:hypothetical protein
MIIISKALRSLYPNSEFAIENEDIDRITWVKNRPSDFDFANDEEKQTKLQQLIDEVNRLDAIEISNTYQIDRRKNYPSIPNQLDMLWHMMDDETIPGKDSVWYQTIKQVKETYPK